MIADTYDQHLQKRYEPCEKCAQGKGICGLGVTLKCSCKRLSATYEFLNAEQLKHMKGVKKEYETALNNLQKTLGKSGKAQLLFCDCGAYYLVRDGLERRRLHNPQTFEEDKRYNREQAAVLRGNGSLKRL